MFINKFNNPRQFIKTNDEELVMDIPTNTKTILKQIIQKKWSIYVERCNPKSQTKFNFCSLLILQCGPCVKLKFIFGSLVGLHVELGLLYYSLCLTKVHLTLIRRQWRTVNCLKMNSYAKI